MTVMAAVTAAQLVTNQRAEMPKAGVTACQLSSLLRSKLE